MSQINMRVLVYLDFLLWNMNEKMFFNGKWLYEAARLI